MARADALGFFWRDEPKVKLAKAAPIKRSPPPRLWENPDYLPNLEEARTTAVPLFNNDTLYQAFLNRAVLDFDTECYTNYFLAGFTDRATKQVVYFEKYNDADTLNPEMLKWVLENFEIIGYNSKNYDLTMLALALAGCTNQQLKSASDMMIVGEMPGYEVLRDMRTKALKDLNHIDLIEVAPSFCSLKLYAGRMNSRRMQDLPFPPSAILTPDQVTVLRWYCFTDLTHTRELASYLSKQIDLRVTIGSEHGEDYRSKSDAQIAEAVIASELRRMGMPRPQKPNIPPGTTYFYQVPNYMRFETPNMNWVLDTIRQTHFIVGESGRVGMPEHIADMLIPIGAMKYQMGIGGLHSTEKTAAHIASADMLLLDTDVESFYPKIMLNLGLFPPQIGPAFLRVFGSIVERRINAKHRKDKVTADALKITINGTYGKLGSKYSFLYAPGQIIQVTLTGQLSLLMLIERLELRGFQVVSANTDGLVTKVPTARRNEFNAIVGQWRAETNFVTEETQYTALYSKDVNNYIALKEDGYKAKGVYANPWDLENEDKFDQLKHNPANVVCLDAAIAALRFGTPVERTVRACTDITRFINVRTVTGGAVKLYGEQPLPPHKDKVELLRYAEFEEIAEGAWIPSGASDRSAMSTVDAYKLAVHNLKTFNSQQYLGKAIRWYYAEGVEGEIVAAKSGNKVPRSDGAMPLMDLPETFPSDVNYQWYEEEARKILRLVGYLD